jgi:hypothetical protein
MVYLYMCGMIFFFFKICVLDCGRYFHTNSCTLDRGRFDYARVLIATSNLEVVNIVYKLLIDGVLVEVKIIEEWGLNLGEDACLFEDDDGSQSSHFDHADIQGDPEACNNVDTSVEKIMNELAKEEMDDLHKTKQHMHIVSDSMVLGNMHVTVAEQTVNMGSSKTVSYMASYISCVMQSIANEV